MKEESATIWDGCYDGGWRGVISPDSFRHPAKFARGLLTRIIDQGLARGWWKPGDIVGDPFGGVGTTGLMCSYRGLRSVSVELEPKFVGFSYDNFYRHLRSWQELGNPLPVYLQGDSRRFAELVGGVAGVATSPPYSNSLTRGDKLPDSENSARMREMGGRMEYGEVGGQIGELPEGEIDGALTSPPYEEGLGHGGGPLTDVDKSKEPALVGQKEAKYGTEPGQLGGTSGETYWEAMALVYAQCLLALKPGGVMAVVVKDYVKKGKRVPLCDQTLELLERLGFRPVERIRAMLVKTESHPGLFGEPVEHTKERKSFFRRLAEQKGSPPIDWEEVLVVSNTNRKKDETGRR